MNIDSALRMIDNEISNFGGQIKMQACLMLPGPLRGDSNRQGGEGRRGGGRGEGGESGGQAGGQRLQWWWGCLEDVTNHHADSGRTGGTLPVVVYLINSNRSETCPVFPIGRAPWYDVLIVLNCWANGAEYRGADDRAERRCLEMADGWIKKICMNCSEQLYVTRTDVAALLPSQICVESKHRPAKSTSSFQQ